MKKWVKERKKKQLSALSNMNINSFEGKVNIKFLFLFREFLTSTTWVKAPWNPSFLVDFLWITYLENRSKKVNISIFAVLSMCESTLDNENRTVVTILRWLPNTMWIHTKSTGLFQKKSKPNRWEGWRRHGISKGIDEGWKFQGSVKKEVEFPQERSRKTHVEWRGHAFQFEFFGNLTEWNCLRFQETWETWRYKKHNISRTKAHIAKL